MLSALFAVSAAVKAQEASGNVNSIDWSFADGVLTLSGNGAIPDYNDGSATTPWGEQTFTITRKWTEYIPIPELQHIYPDGYPVEREEKETKKLSDLLTKVIINEGITSVGISAFQNMPSLVRIELPSSITSVKANAFQGCTNLKEISWSNISENVSIENTSFAATGLVKNKMMFVGTQLVFVYTDATSADITGATKIHGNAFKDCNKITSITIPSTVTAIGSNAFANCTSLTQVVFENAKNIKTWGSNIFSGIAGETDGDYKMIGNSVILDVVNTGKKKYAISSDVAYIAENAFAGCSKVEYLDLSDCQRAPVLATGALTDVPTTKTTLVKPGYEGNFGSSWGNVNTTKIQIYNNRFVSRTFLHNAVVPSDVAVYRAEVADNKVKLIKVENHGNPVIVEAGVGVFLRTTATGEKEFKTGGLSDCTEIGNNKLVGVKEDVTLKAGQNAYIIATVNGVQDFYLVNGDYPLSMGKAYLDGTELSGSKLQFMDTDGIDEISSAPMHKTQIFNINGQRLSSPKEGLNIINGKKVIVNN